MIPALSNTFCALAPHGTWLWHSATFIPGLARSATPVTAAGLAGGTAISRTLRANVLDPAAALAAMTCVMFVAEAEANTSAGAPSMICSARAELAPKLSSTLTPGWAASNLSARVLNDSVSDAAANTLTVPVIADPVGAPARAAEPAPGAAVEPHPAAAVRASAASAGSSLRGQLMLTPRILSCRSALRRRRWWP